MNNYELRLLAHTLGYRLGDKSWNLENYRNHYVAVEGSTADDLFQNLVKQGMAEQMGTPTFVSPEHVVFRATKAGHEATLEMMASLTRKERIKIACLPYL